MALNYANVKSIFRVELKDKLNFDNIQANPHHYGRSDLFNRLVQRKKILYLISMVAVCMYVFARDCGTKSYYIETFNFPSYTLPNVSEPNLFSFSERFPLKFL